MKRKWSMDGGRDIATASASRADASGVLAAAAKHVLRFVRR
jgi:hypothetical protein